MAAASRPHTVKPANYAEPGWTGAPGCLELRPAYGL